MPIIFNALFAIFCAGGLFIELNDHSDLEYLAPKQTLQIRFSINRNQDSHDYSQEITIMHLNSIGFGVAFEGNSEAFFNALKRRNSNSYEHLFFWFAN